jgi:hypothetical protein
MWHYWGNNRRYIDLPVVSKMKIFKKMIVFSSK